MIDEVIEMMYHMKVLDKFDDSIYVTVSDAIKAISDNNKMKKNNKKPESTVNELINY